MIFILSLFLVLCSLQTTLGASTPSSIPQCNTPQHYDTYAICRYRDDITQGSQMVFTLYFLIFTVLFLKSIWNLVVIWKIQRYTPSYHMNRINHIICLFFIFQLLFYSDGPLQLLFNTVMPLYLYLFFQWVSIIMLNSALCIGGYVWIMTIFTASFNNRYKSIVQIVCPTLLVFNGLFLVYITSMLFYGSIHDSDHNNISRIIFLRIAGICLMASTALNAAFFAIGCWSLRNYLTKNWVNFGTEEGTTLARLAIAGIIISIIRLIQNLIAVFWNLPGMLKRNSALETNHWWAVYLAVYLLLVNILPALYFLQKYTPNLNDKIDSKVRNSELGGLLVRAIHDSITMAEDKFTQSFLVNSMLLSDSDSSESRNKSEARVGESCNKIAPRSQSQPAK